MPGVTATGTYNPYGTARIEAWSETFERTWRVVGDDQVCYSSSIATHCYRFEINTDAAGEYRSIHVATGESVAFRIVDALAEPVADAAPADDDGGLGAPSAAEIAAALSDPNTNLGSMNLQFDYIEYQGAFGAALARSFTVREYLRTGIRMIGTQNGQVRFWLTPERDELRVHQSVAGPPGLGRSVADVHTLVSTIGMLQRFIGAGWQPDEVALAAGAELQLLQGGVQISASK